MHAEGFVSKSVFVLAGPRTPLNIGTAAPFAETTLAPSGSLRGGMLSTGPLGGQELGLLRFSDNTGAFVLAQNPLLSLSLRNASQLRVSVAYSADILHDPGHSYTLSPAFAVDTACLGVYNLTGWQVPPPLRKGLSSLKPWAPAAQGAESAAGAATSMHSTRGPTGERSGPAPPAATLALDEAERDAVTACAAAYYVSPPTVRSVKMNVAWTENDYQMDMSNATQAAEYHRIMKTLAAIGVGAITYAPSNSNLSTRANATDNWGWEEALWFSLGEHIRMDRWMPGRDPVPPSVATPLQWAKQLGIDLHPYIYPILPFSQNPSWLTPDGKQAYLGNPDLLAFVYATLGEGAGGALCGRQQCAEHWSARCRVLQPLFRLFIAPLSPQRRFFFPLSSPPRGLSQGNGRQRGHV